MSPYRGLLGVGHFLASLVANQQRYLPFACCPLFLLLGYPHFLHIEVHADFCLFFDGVKQKFLYLVDSGHSLVLFVLGVEVEVVDRHRADGLAVEGLYFLDLLGYPSALEK